MKRFISFIFVFVCFIAQSSILRANHDYIKFIDATECNIDPFKYNFPYYKRKWNGIDIPKDIWKLIDKYRRNLFSIVHLRPTLPYKYTPEYIMNKLMSSVDFDCVVLCSQCDVDVPVKFHINKSSNSGNPICLDGLPLRRNYMPPYECPICGTFCGKPALW